MTTPDIDQDADADALRARLAEAEEMLRAIRQGDIDALVVDSSAGHQVYTLHGADEPYRNLVEQMQEGAVVMTAGGDILYCNARFATLVGEPIESVVGKSIDRFVPLSDRENVTALLASGTGRRRSRLVASDRGAVEVSLSLITTASASGERLNLIVTDLSELLEANSGRDRAERDNRSKDDFLAMLAHELRDPLGAIRNAVRVLELTHAQGVSATRAHDVIARQVSHLSHLINDLLDVERVVSGKTQLNPQPLDLAVAVRAAAATVTGQGSIDRKIDISTESVWVNADPVRLEQVLTNILTNAVKYTLPGGQIRVTLHAESGDAVLRVEDTGFGISAELMPFVFDLYTQIDRTLDRSRGGLGIGLTLVRRLVELHGGTVTASSPGEGHGSTFTIRLNQIPSKNESVADAVRPERRATPRRVLVIEDSGDAREMLRMMLQLDGHVVYDAADGASGLELLNAVRPDVGIIDLGLPRMDGYEVAKRIREEPYGRGMLLLALTGEGSIGDAQRSAARGFDYHLVKPVDPDQLGRLLSESASDRQGISA